MLVTAHPGHIEPEHSKLTSRYSFRQSVHSCSQTRLAGSIAVCGDCGGGRREQHMNDVRTSIYGN